MVLKVESKTNCYKEETYEKLKFFFLTLDLLLKLCSIKKLENFTTHPHSEKCLLRSCYSPAIKIQF